MKLAALLLVWVATIGVCIAFPTMHAVKKQQVDWDRCRDAVISIPKWFCTNISTQDRPDWLHKICDAIQQPTELQQTTGAVLPIIPDWICGTKTVEGRLEKIKNVCKAIERFNDPNIGLSLGIPITLCSLGESGIKEQLLVACGEEQQTLNEPEFCSYISNPYFLFNLFQNLCNSGADPEMYHLPRTICTVPPEHRVELLRAQCGGARAQQAVNGVLDTRVCEALDLSGFKAWLEFTCVHNPQVVTSYGIPLSVCTAAATPENRIEMLRPLCSTLPETTAKMEQVPPYLCSDPTRVLTNCEGEPGIPDWICSLPPQQRMEELHFLCGMVPEMRAKMEQVPPYVCSDPTRVLTNCEGEPGIPDWICSLPPEERMEKVYLLCRSVPEMMVKMEQLPLYVCSDPARVLNNCEQQPGIPLWVCHLLPEQRMHVLRSECGGILTAEKQQTGERVPSHICAMQVEHPSIFLQLLTTFCEELGMPQSICHLPPQLRLKAVEEECGHATKVIDQQNDTPVTTKVPKWICNGISKLGLPTWLSNICEMNENSLTPDVCDL